MDRRTLLTRIGAVGTAGVIAGCSQQGSGNPSTAEPYGNGTLDMNLSPSVAQEQLEAQYAPVRDHLGSELDVTANMNLANNYSAVIQALGSGTADVAETGPFAAALGVDAGKAEVVLQRKGYGSWTYKSLVAVPEDSDVQSLSDLQGKTVAFSDRLSTSGCLYPLYNIKTEGGLSIGGLPETGGSEADFEAVFAGGHPQSYQTMKSGQADACGIGGFVPGTVDDFEGNARVLKEQTGLPRAPIVVSPELADEEASAITDAFTGAPDEIYWGADGEEGTDDDLWFSAVREASVDRYQSVVDVAKELGVGSDIFEQAQG